MKKQRTIHEVAFRLSYDMGVQIAPRLIGLNISLAPQQLRAMRRVWAKGETTLADICTTLKRDKGQVTRIIDELCKSQLLLRKPNPRDGRSKLIELTPQGYKLFETIEEIEAKFSNQLTKGISQKDLDVFFQVSDQLSENIRLLED